MVLAAFPMVYLGLYAIILASIDRFAMPAYPATLAILIIFPVLISQRFRSRRAVPQGEPNAIAVAAARNQS